MISKIQGWIILTPAYGRDYKSKKEILADFDANKDFVLNLFTQSTYINKEQIAPGTRIEFRYGKLQKLFVHKVEEIPSMILTPTSGVEYKSKRAVLKDFNNNEEFAWERSNTISYTSRSTIKKGTVVEFRYDNQGKSFTHKVT